MKKYDAMRLSGTILLAHLALCAAFPPAAYRCIRLNIGLYVPLALRTWYWDCCSSGYRRLPLAGGLRSAKDPFDKKLCWNAAMVLYVLNAAAFLLAPEFGTGM